MSTLGQRWDCPPCACRTCFSRWFGQAQIDITAAARRRLGPLWEIRPVTCNWVIRWRLLRNHPRWDTLFAFLWLPCCSFAFLTQPTIQRSMQYLGGWPSDRELWYRNKVTRTCSLRNDDNMYYGLALSTLGIFDHLPEVADSFHLQVIFRSGTQHVLWFCRSIQIISNWVSLERVHFFFFIIAGFMPLTNAEYSASDLFLERCWSRHRHRGCHAKFIYENEKYPTLAQINSRATGFA
jgi:hypothetical protein